MKKKVIQIIVCIFLALSIYGKSYAQNYVDVLRYSLITNNGTARYVSMGGAFGALGADFTSISYNPAGLGVYRSSEFTVTPSFKSNGTNSNYSGISNKSSLTKFGFDNVGFVTSFSNSKSDESGLVMVNLGFGYNKMIDFSSETVALGPSTSSSIMDYFATRTNGFAYSDLTYSDEYNPFTSTSAPWDAIMAWNTYLVDTIPGTTSSYYAYLNSGDGVDQEQSVYTQGSMGEFVISMASNFSNQLFLGATIGIQNITFSGITTHNETAFSTNDLYPNGDRFTSLSYKQTLDVDGNGFNFKIGAIYKPIQFLRVGLALHTPTYYSLNEVYRAYMSSERLNGSSSITSPKNGFDYGIESPYKMIGSLAFTLEDKGLVSLDVEYVDYSTMRLNEGGDGETFTAENRYITNSFQNAINLKGGGEFWIGDFALRAGYTMYGSPYKSGINADSKTTIASGGVGYKSGSLFIDLAYQRMVSQDYFYMYNLVNTQEISIIDPIERKITQGKVLMTVGYKF